ncbi:hypothetical protein BC834DRAFT_971244 [Gloeopeniophorella convolvens]|nr:hypothetical protein BC834DRAFT_971244 [Gloeopeniophorella convolvens]
MKRRHSDEDAPLRSSPSNASSRGEGDLADTEMEPGPSAGPSADPRAEPSAGPGADAARQAREKSDDGAAAAPPPLKKKRTRTLTTPHQSAVLHALLAQSRFPTTAMREEVGRSIGLSARKVQVWFQASLERPLKARRPRSQGSAPLTRPPQYGAFSNLPASAPPAVGPSQLSPSSGQSTFYAAPPGPFGQFSLRQEYLEHEDPARAPMAGPSPSTGYLSGPGVPGASSSLAPRYPPGPPPPPPPAGYPPQRWSPYESHPSTRPPFSEPRLPAPSRDFTYSLPPLQVPEHSGSRFSQTQFLPMALPPPPRLHEPQPRPLTVESRSYSTESFFVPHLPPQESAPAPARNLPRLQIPPLQVPETPRVQRSAPPYSSLPDPMRFPPNQGDPVPSVTPGTPRGGSPPPPLRARRFDPVREAASERGSSQGTDVPTPPHTDTPHA